MSEIKVFTCNPTGDGNGLYPVNESDVRKTTSGFRGKPMKSTWIPIAVEPWDIARVDLVLDFIDFGSSPTFSARAIKLLGEVLSECGEILPLESGFGDFYMLNVTNLADALDEDKSDIQRLPSGIATHANKYAFQQNKLPGNPIFKVPLFTARTFYTSEFVNLVAQTDLKGFEFTEL